MTEEGSVGGVVEAQHVRLIPGPVKGTRVLSIGTGPLTRWQVEYMAVQCRHGKTVHQQLYPILRRLSEVQLYDFHRWLENMSGKERRLLRMHAEVARSDCKLRPPPIVRVTVGDRAGMSAAVDMLAVLGDEMCRTRVVPRVQWDQDKHILAVYGNETVWAGREASAYRCGCGTLRSLLTDCEGVGGRGGAEECGRPRIKWIHVEGEADETHGMGMLEDVLAAQSLKGVHCKVPVSDLRGSQQLLFESRRPGGRR